MEYETVQQYSKNAHVRTIAAIITTLLGVKVANTQSLATCPSHPTLWHDKILCNSASIYQLHYKKLMLLLIDLTSQYKN